MSLADCMETRFLRYSSFPMTSSLALRLTMMFAPFPAWETEGGDDTQRSSQISADTERSP